MKAARSTSWGSSFGMNFEVTEARAVMRSWIGDIVAFLVAQKFSKPFPV